MRTTQRIALFGAALSLALAPAVTAAAAPPVSTYDITIGWSEGSLTGSLALTVDESGAVTGVLSQQGFSITVCPDGSPGTANGTWTASGPATTTALSVDRKLSAFSWEGTLEVSYQYMAFCSGVVTTEVGTNVPTAVSVTGSSEGRITRDRVDGDRVLSSMLSTNTIIDGLSEVTTTAVLTETISRG